MIRMRRKAVNDCKLLNDYCASLTLAERLTLCAGR